MDFIRTRRNPEGMPNQYQRVVHSHRSKRDQRVLDGKVVLINDLYTDGIIVPPIKLIIKGRDRYEGWHFHR